MIEPPERTFIGRIFDKIENSGVRIRTYNNQMMFLIKSEIIQEVMIGTIELYQDKIMM